MWKPAALFSRLATARPIPAAARYIQAHMAPGDGVICFDEYAGLFAGHPLEQLGPSTDVPEQARRVLDAAGIGRLVSIQ